MNPLFNAQSQSPVAPQTDVAELHPIFAGICRSFNETLGLATSTLTKQAPSAISVEGEVNCPEDSAPTIFTCPVTVRKNVRQPENITIRDISYVMAAIKQGFYEGYNLKKVVEVIRGMTDRDAQRSAKSALPWFSGSVMHTKRANANVQHARFMIFDLDHVADIEGTKALAISKFAWIRYAFRSVTDGVKLVAMLNKPITDESKYRAIYSYLCLQIETLLKIPCDNTPDWARACYFSYDPGLIDNLHGLKPIDTEDYYRQAMSFRALPQGLATSALTKRTQSAVSGSFTGSASPGNQREAGISPIDSIATDYAKAAQIVAVLSKIKLDRQDWIKIGFALYARFGEGGKPLWDMFVDNPNYHDTQRIIDVHWHSFKRVRSITISSLFYIAEKYGVSYE